MSIDSIPPSKSSILKQAACPRSATNAGAKYCFPKKFSTGQVEIGVGTCVGLALGTALGDTLGLTLGIILAVILGMVLGKELGVWLGDKED